MIPQHSVTAALVWVPAEAFDAERVKAERGEMDDDLRHPVVQYLSLRTRLDLDAPFQVGDRVATAREYIRPEHTAPVWTGRRLKAMSCARCNDVGGQEGALQAFIAGYVSCSIEGTPKMTTRPLTEAQFEALADRFGVAALVEAGTAFLRASEAPTDAEKKP